VLSHNEMVRLYGPWRLRTPDDARRLFGGYEGRWWIAGGWAIEAYTGIARAHGDLDPSIPRSEVDLFHRHLAGRLDVWQAESGALRPMLTTGDPVPDGCENLWLRPSGAEPWEYDVILMTATSTTWIYKRDARISLPVEEIVWTRDGIAYLRPEIQLLHKAKGLRANDQADFDACIRLLEPEPRAWLRSALNVAHPRHPWLAHL
jgi:hypothetical protein